MKKITRPSGRIFNLSDCFLHQNNTRQCSSIKKGLINDKYLIAFFECQLIPRIKCQSAIKFLLFFGALGSCTIYAGMWNYIFTKDCCLGVENLSPKCIFKTQSVKNALTNYPNI